MQTLNVLITRPKHQATALIEAVQAAGYQAYSLPSIEIVPLPCHSELAQLLAHIQQYQCIIFTSANAVLHSLEFIYQLLDKQPKQLRVVAIGPATKRALEAVSCHVDIMPAVANSESLLNLSELHDVNRQHIAIIKGASGRELLAQGLQERGASVSGISVYQRQQPAHEPAIVTRHCLDWQVNVVVTTSSESLFNFYQMLDANGKAWLQQVTLLLISERMLATVHQLKLQSPLIIADNASEAAIMAALNDIGERN